MCERMGADLCGVCVFVPVYTYTRNRNERNSTESERDKKKLNCMHEYRVYLLRVYLDGRMRLMVELNVTKSTQIRCDMRFCDVKMNSISM